MRATRRSELSDHRPETPLECSKTFYLQHARMLTYSRILVETKNRRTRDQRLHPPCRCAWLPTGTKNRGIGRQTQRVPNMMFGTRIGEKQPRAKTSPTYARELRSRSNQAGAWPWQFARFSWDKDYRVRTVSWNALATPSGGAEADPRHQEQTLLMPVAALRETDPREWSTPTARSRRALQEP